MNFLRIGISVVGVKAPKMLLALNFLNNEYEYRHKAKKNDLDVIVLTIVDSIHCLTLKISIRKRARGNFWNANVSSQPQPLR